MSLGPGSQWSGSGGESGSSVRRTDAAAALSFQDKVAGLVINRGGGGIPWPWTEFSVKTLSPHPPVAETLAAATNLPLKSLPPRPLRRPGVLHGLPRRTEVGVLEQYPA